ncbi:hypothetical protein ACLOJK_000140 [Asimina triloba]
MAKNTTPGILISLLVAISISAIATAQSPAPAPSAAGMMAPAPAMDCVTPLLNLSNCLTFVEEGSNLTKPEKGCCPGLSDLISSAPVCLCQLLANTSAASSFGIQIDRSKALSLTTICKTDLSVSLCSLLGVPVSAPTEAPTSPTPASSTDGSSSASSSPGASPVGTGHGVSNSPFSVLALLISLSAAAAAIF